MLCARPWRDHSITGTTDWERAVARDQERAVARDLVGMERGWSP